MNNKSAVTVPHQSIFGEMVSWFFGVLFLAIGLINTFWGNDPGYGVFTLLLSLAYFPPANAFLRKISGISIPLIVKIILGAFIIWSALGVGELFDKIDLMIQAFNA